MEEYWVYSCPNKKEKRTGVIQLHSHSQPFPMLAIIIQHLFLITKIVVRFVENYGNPLD